jgi:hypothetical protein
MGYNFVKSKAKRWYRRGLNHIKDRQQDHMCQGGRRLSVHNLKLSDRGTVWNCLTNTKQPPYFSMLPPFIFDSKCPPRVGLAREKTKTVLGISFDALHDSPVGGPFRRHNRIWARASDVTFNLKLWLVGRRFILISQICSRVTPFHFTSQFDTDVDIDSAHSCKHGMSPSLF